MKKYLFLIDALVVWCPTWSKYLGRTLMHLFATVYSFVGQFSLRAHNSSHLYFSAPISCSMPIVKNLWDIPYYTMLCILSRYHCLDYRTYCAFLIQINFSELFPICSYDTFEFPYFHWTLETMWINTQHSNKHLVKDYSKIHIWY